jgi:hypothetical protein
MDGDDAVSQLQEAPIITDQPMACGVRPYHTPKITAKENRSGEKDAAKNRWWHCSMLLVMVEQADGSQEYHEKRKKAPS